MKKKFPFLMLRVGPTGPRTKLMFGYSRNWNFKEIVLFERNSGLKRCKSSRLLQNSFQEQLPEGKTIKKLCVCGRYIWTLPVNGLQVKPIPLLTAWWDWSNWSHHTHLLDPSCAYKLHCRRQCLASHWMNSVLHKRIGLTIECTLICFGLFLWFPSG
jgi:hypothetical protein